MEHKPIDILTSAGTPLICTSCGTFTAQAFYLRRQRGLYALLCFRNGEGCWERSSRGPCSFVDEYQAQCTLLAEYEIVSLSGETSRQCCVGHIPALMAPGSPGQTVYPLED
jgi:hypothetical protein